jgi:hypothetical protein
MSLQDAAMQTDECTVLDMPFVSDEDHALMAKIVEMLYYIH